MAHSATLELLLINIIKNSARHGGAHNLHLHAREANSAIIIEVSDDGSGVDNDIAGELFEWGKSGNTKKGTGIGLAHACERMAAMGGTIECEPHGGLPNQSGTNGAKFILTLQKAIQ